MKPARPENPSEDPKDVAYVDAAIENRAKSTIEQLAQESIPFTEEIEKRIPQIRQFFVEYLRELGINPEEDPDFSEAGTGTIGEWFDDVETFYHPSVAHSKELKGDGQTEFAGFGHNLGRWALISKKQMETGGREDIVNFYGPAALGHEIYHAMSSNTFSVWEDEEISDSSLRWIKNKGSGAAYNESSSHIVDLEKTPDGNYIPVVQNGFYMTNGDPSPWKEEDWNWTQPDEDKPQGRLFRRRGNLLEEGLATIIELRIRDRLATDFPEISQESEKAIEGYLQDHPNEPQFREGLYLGDGFKESPNYDPKNNIIPSIEYRKGVQVFKMLADKFTELTGDPWYFERLVQKARMLAQHDALWREVENVAGDELAQRLKFLNSKNIDSVLEELKTKIAESGAS